MRECPKMQDISHIRRNDRRSQLSGDEGKENFDYEKDYVNAFIDIVDPQILSYDHYALIYDKKKRREP